MRSALGKDVGQNERKSNIQRQIDENLRRVYRETLEEEVPDRFTELLNRLAEKDTGRNDRNA